MSLHVNNQGGGEFELTPEGLYVARCYRLIDCGTQTITNSWGTKHVKKVSISWELLDDDVHMEDGRPYSAHQTYTASMADTANLRMDLEKWFNKEFSDQEIEDFDLSTIIDTYCQVQIGHSDDKKFANVKSIVMYKAPKNDKGEKVYPKAVNENVVFDLDEPDLAVFDKLGESLKKKIMSSPEWQEYQSKPKPKVEEKEEGEKVKEALDKGDNDALPQDFKDAFGGADGIPDITKEDIEQSAETAKKAAGKTDD